MKVKLKMKYLILNMICISYLLLLLIEINTRKSLFFKVIVNNWSAS